MNALAGFLASILVKVLSDPAVIAALKSIFSSSAEVATPNKALQDDWNKPA